MAAPGERSGGECERAPLGPDGRRRPDLGARVRTGRGGGVLSYSHGGKLSDEDVWE